MKSTDHPRVKELLNVNRMVYPSPGDDNIEYYMGGNYLEGLTDLVDEFVTPEMEICEIGSFRGVSSELFALFCKKLYCVDKWSEDAKWYDEIAGGWKYEGHPELTLAESHFDERMLNYSNVIKVRKESTIASNDFSDESLDLIYIDGDHTEQGFRNDMDSWIPKVKSSGVISGHDYSMVHPFLADYVDLSTINKYQDGSWAYRK